MITQLATGSAQVVTISGTSAQSAVFATRTSVRVISNTLCWIAVGTNPTAAADTAGNVLLPSGMPIDLDIDGGDRIAVIQDASGGHLSITPILSQRRG